MKIMYSFHGLLGLCLQFQPNKASSIVEEAFFEVKDRVAPYILHANTKGKNFQSNFNETRWPLFVLFLDYFMIFWQTNSRRN